MRFTPQAVGRLDPANQRVTVFPVTNAGPEAITASPDGSLWFTQTTKDNIARITNTGVITEAKASRAASRSALRSTPGDPVVHDDGGQQDRRIPAALDKGRAAP